MPSRFMLMGAALALLAATTAAPATDKGHPRGAVEQRGGDVGQNPILPALNLTDADREQIRRAVLTEHTGIQFQLKSTKGAKDFTPAVGARLPKGLTPAPMPQTLILQMPRLRDYTYVKMKNQVLIVNAMTRKIVDLFPETQSRT